MGGFENYRSASRFIGAGVSRFHQTCNEGGFDSMAYGATGECGDREFEAMEEADRVSAEFDGTPNVNVLCEASRTEQASLRVPLRNQCAHPPDPPIKQHWPKPLICHPPTG